jgi:hemolysin activation/secretion protein
MRFPSYSTLILCSVAAPAIAAPQVPLDRSDPGIATREVRPVAPAPLAAKPTIGTVAPLSPVIARVPGGIVRAIRVDGGDGLPADQLAAATASFTGRHLGADDLADLLVTVSAVARAQGYLFAHSTLPAQRLVDGILVVRLDKGRVDEVRLVGTQDKAVAAALAPLVGTTPRANEVERRLMLAGDRPGVAIGQVTYVREGARGVLLVPLRHDRFAANANIDNWGNKDIGPLRAQVGFDLTGLFDGRDQLTVQDLFTLAKPHELNVVVARYAYQPDSDGTKVSLDGSYGKTHPGGFLRDYDLSGMSYSIGAAVSRPLIRSRKASLWVSAEFDNIGTDQSFSGGRVRRDRLTTASLSVNGYTPAAGGRLTAGIGATQGLDILGATDRGDPLASRPDAGGQFTRVSAWANWTGALVGPLSVALAASGQAATRPLLAVEQISIGGPVFGRAYDFSERSGDRGVLGSAELRGKLFSASTGPLRYVQLYGFGDAGTVSNLRNDLGTGDLYSAGLGTRIDFARSIRLGLEAAYPLNADRFTSHDRSPRISFSLSSSL